MTEETLILKEKKPFTYQISAFSLLGFGFLFIISGFSLILGIVLILISIFFIIMVKGTELDFAEKKYREVKIFGNSVTGKWLDLPEIKYILLFRAIMTQQLNNPGRGSNNITEISEYYILIKLIYSNQKKLTIYKTKNYDDALNTAKLIAQKLNLKIYDAISKHEFLSD